ncbi:MAG: UUP1 family membrane protein [Verrucomicrobia bacterium]|nr:UUP1 family membrane protein [Verrucomicrobiota bacterium]
MMKFPFVAVVLALFLVAGGLVAFKVRWMNYPVLPPAETPLWVVKAEIGFDTGTGPVTLRLAVPPKLQPGLQVTDQVTLLPGYSCQEQLSASDNRQIVWSGRDTVPQRRQLVYRAIVSPRTETVLTTPVRPATPTRLGGLTGEAADRLLQEWREASADDLTQARQLFEDVYEEWPGNLDLQRMAEGLAAVGGPLRSTLAATLTVRLLRQAGWPARSVHGLLLQQDWYDAAPQCWVEIWLREGWQRIGLEADPDGGTKALVLWYDDDDMLTSDGVGNLERIVSVSRLPERSSRPVGDFPGPVPGSLRAGLEHLVDTVSSFSLPPRTQAVYRILLTVPLGALLVIFFRNLIGLQTFGIFMPVLIALAFRETRLLWGIALFLLVITGGVLARFGLMRFKLLMVPRLGAILTLVVLMMFGISLATQKFEMIGGLAVALFPMVVVTMTIERMSIIWEEHGMRRALRQVADSLFCAIMVYLLITNLLVEHLVFFFPELLLVCLALTLLAGRYAGYRLLEIARFKELAKDIGDVEFHS